MVPATMLPAASSVVRSTTSLMKTKLLPQKMATLKSSTSATSALRREACVLPRGVAIAANPIRPGERAGRGRAWAPPSARRRPAATRRRPRRR